AFGFTSVVDLDLKPRDKAWFAAAALHPHLYSCGPGIKVAGGYMALKVSVPASVGFPNLVFEPKEAQDWTNSVKPHDYTADEAVARAAGMEAICVKAFVESGFGTFKWPYLHTETLQQIRAAASRRQLLLVVQANSVDSWRETIDAGDGMIAHGVGGWALRPAASQPSQAVLDVISRGARPRIDVQPT